MKIACCVSHLDDPGIWACLGTIAKLRGVELDPVRVVIGKRPMAASLNAALDLAHHAEADLLLHMESDVLLTPQAMERMLAAHVPGETYLVVGHSYDPLVDRITAGHVRLFDMRVLRDRFRFSDDPALHQAFCVRVEQETGLVQTTSAGEEAVAYWHPVWTARELHAQFRDVFPGLQDDALKVRMESFLTRGLTLDPQNRALQAGIAGLQASLQAERDAGGGDAAGGAGAFTDYTAQMGLDGTEYYVRHKFYASLAKGILDSDVQCVCDRPQPHVPLIHWR